MKVLRYRIALRQPLLAPGLGGDPNNILGLPYLPGATLRGAMIARYIEAQVPGMPFDPTDPQIRRLFFDGDCRFLNGYPVDYRDRRMLPTPNAWQCEKGRTSPIRDFAVASPPADDDRDWRGVRAPFHSTSTEESTVWLHTPARQVNLHTNRDRTLGRARADVGDIYTYDALAPEQTFAAAILCDLDDDAGLLRPLLAGEFRLGRAISTYGAVTFAPEAEVGADWREQPAGDGDAEDDDREGADDATGLTVTLLADALLRDNWGRARTDIEAVATAVAKALTAAGAKVQLRPRAAFFGVTRRRGFNRVWGLPLPEDALLRMGGVFVFDLVGTVSAGQFRQVEWTGIGALRAEGCGRVLLNGQQIDEWTLREPPRASSTLPVPITSTAGKALAKRMVARMQDQRIHSTIVARVLGERPEIRLTGTVPVSQLARLRSVIHAELLRDAPGLACLEDFAAGLRAPAKRHFERTRIDGQSLFDWLRSLPATTGEMRRALLFGPRENTPPSIGDFSANLDDTALACHTLRLVDAIVARAAKQQRGRQAYQPREKAL
jgi:CRISPR-associated Csx10 family RAMP protein